MPQIFNNTNLFDELVEVFRGIEKPEQGISIRQVHKGCYSLIVEINKMFPTLNQRFGWIRLANVEACVDTKGDLVSPILYIRHISKKHIASADKVILFNIKKGNDLVIENLDFDLLFGLGYKTYTAEYHTVTQIRHFIEGEIKNLTSAINKLPKRIQLYERQIALAKFKRNV